MEQARATAVVVHAHAVIRAALAAIVQSAPEFTLAAVLDSPMDLDADVLGTGPTLLIIGVDDAVQLDRERLQTWVATADIRLIAVSETFSNTTIVALCRLTVFDALILWDEPLDAVLVAARRLLRGESLLTGIIGKGRVVHRLLTAARTNDAVDADVLVSPLTTTDRSTLGHLVASGDRRHVMDALGITQKALFDRERTAYLHLDIRNPYLAQAYALSRHFITPMDMGAAHCDARDDPAARGRACGGPPDGDNAAGTDVYTSMLGSRQQST